MKIELIPAEEQHIEDILSLVNLAYRGEKGWTTERKIVAGDRVKPAEILAAINAEQSHLLLYFDAGALLGSICVEKQGDSAHIGLFAVQPNAQGKGIGKAILSYAEWYAGANLNVKRCVMAVVIGRDELIAYYERRGYYRTGTTEDYPEHRDVGTPKVSGLKFEYMEKPI